MAKKNRKFWIQGAIKHPGSTEKWCKAHGFGGVNAACLAAMKKTGNKSLIGKAVLAQRFRGGEFHKAIKRVRKSIKGRK